MAAASKIATKPKKKVVRAVRRGTNMMPLMPMKDITWNRAKFYTHYEVEVKEWLTTVKGYIKKNYDKKIVAAVNKLPEWKVGGKSHWACAAYLLENHAEIVPLSYSKGIKKWILELAEEGAALVEIKNDEDAAAPKNVHVPTIQERITEQAQEACQDIEEWLDGFITDKKTFDPKGFDFVSHFARNKISQAHARKIKGYYARELEEAQLIQKLPTPGEINRVKDAHEQDMLQQLREGYSHLTKKDTAVYLVALETLVGACDMVIDASNATRKPRVKKAPSKDKMIAKLKYMVKDEKLQLVSVNPLELIASSEVWVYNVKTRKLGKYVAEEGQHMQVSGTTLTFFDEAKSVQKTLRKPEESLKEFKKLGKVKLRTYLEDIKTTDIKLNGRLNADTLILKVFQ
jgi:hypothetical protein|tara:strand:- start:171 stop:1373 length:1203 start_codon:yes stop_codon:yes gene_type:complete